MSRTPLSWSRQLAARLALALLRYAAAKKSAAELRRIGAAHAKRARKAARRAAAA